MSEKRDSVAVTEGNEGIVSKKVKLLSEASQEQEREMEEEETKGENEGEATGDNGQGASRQSRGDEEEEVEETKAFIFESVIERYFTRFFITDVWGKEGEDQYVHLHSNGLAVVGLASFHPLLRGSPLASVSFATGKNKRDLADVKIRGKKKKGALFAQPEMTLCEATCEGGTVYSVRAGIRGNLIEVNTNLLKTPSLLKDKPETEGFVAIISVKNYWDPGRMALKTLDEYKQFRQATKKSE